METSRLGLINAQKADKAIVQARHENVLGELAKVSDTVLSSTSALIQYLEGHTSKTEVVNQLEAISTPDVQYVVEALRVLDDTLKTHENTDLSEVTGVMRELLNEARQIPKTLPDAPEAPAVIDYTDQLHSLQDAIQAIEKVVKAQKLIAEAPIVNVPAPNVNVDAPDLKPLQDGFTDVVKAVKAIVIPEFKTDNKAVEKLLEKANKVLQKILEKPVSSGGGGGSSWPAVGTSGNPAPLNVNANGDLTVAPGVYTERYDYDDGTTIYTAQASLGTADASTGWIITKYNLTDSGNASATIATDVSWTNRTTGTYN